eukprot:14406566-Alexandrium_andersonii.AAC.1
MRMRALPFHERAKTAALFASRDPNRKRARNACRVARRSTTARAQRGLRVGHGGQGHLEERVEHHEN